MARIRTIKPSFWDDLKVGKLCRDARLTYIGLWTFADDCGVVIGNIFWLKSKIYPTDQIQIQQFEKWITELEINGFIYLFPYKNEKFIYLPTFSRHQVINKPNMEDLNVPKDVLDKQLQQITYQSRNNHGIITEQSVPIKGEEKDKEKDNISCACDDEEFDKFWDLYDKKCGDKSKIKAKFNKLSRADKDKIFETLPTYVANTPNKTYRKNPETYLNNKSWNDEIIPDNGRQPQSQGNWQANDLSKFRDNSRHYSSESDI